MLFQGEVFGFFCVLCQNHRWLRFEQSVASNGESMDCQAWLLLRLPLCLGGWGLGRGVVGDLLGVSHCCSGFWGTYYWIWKWRVEQVGLGPRERIRGLVLGPRERIRDPGVSSFYCVARSTQPLHQVVENWRWQMVLNAEGLFSIGLPLIVGGESHRCGRRLYFSPSCSTLVEQLQLNGGRCR